MPSTIRVAGLLGASLLGACAGPQASGHGRLADAAFAGEAAFTRAVQPRVQQAVGSRSAARIAGPLSLVVERPGEGRNEVNLDRMYRFCRADPDRCEPAVENFVASLAEFPPNAQPPGTLGAEALRLVVRPSAYVAQLRQELGRTPEGAPVVAPLVGRLELVVVLDLPRSVLVLSRGRAAELGLSDAQAIARARANTAAALRPVIEIARPLPIGDNEIAALSTDPFYESSRLADHAAWTLIARGARGRLLALAPDVGTVLYLDSAQPGALQALVDLGADLARRAERPLPLEVLAWAPGGWQSVPAPAPRPRGVQS
jgi:hypothetical protein